MARCCVISIHGIMVSETSTLGLMDCTLVLIPRFLYFVEYKEEGQALLVCCRNGMALRMGLKMNNLVSNHAYPNH